MIIPKGVDDNRGPHIKEVNVTHLALIPPRQAITSEAWKISRNRDRIKTIRSLLFRIVSFSLIMQDTVEECKSLGVTSINPFVTHTISYTHDIKI